MAATAGGSGHWKGIWQRLARFQTGASGVAPREATREERELVVGGRLAWLAGGGRGGGEG
jgi:hypothetical protein